MFDLISPALNPIKLEIREAIMDDAIASEYTSTCTVVKELNWDRAVDMAFSAGIGMGLVLCAMIGLVIVVDRRAKAKAKDEDKTKPWYRKRDALFETD